ncbi:helix-turn-helix transcriptional regulator [Halorhabdus amylolytica]|uniref:helix-turn-helix transcriptional regulator n=1 Tax=Halorhabdus amylolytica TaxID=2559573 RepID=UPI0010AAEA8B|nr:helix-turn-helix transcriptional regulator [Halorhabdus amylolytica]
MSNRERSDTGEFVEAVSHSRVLDVFHSVSGPVVTSTDVAEDLDCSTETARRKLGELYRDGVLDRRKSGRTVVWWVVNDYDVGPKPVDPDDPLFADRPSFASGREDLAESVDDVLYRSES